MVAVLTLVGVAGAPAAVASDHNVVVDLGGPHAAGVLVVVYFNEADFKAQQSFDMNDWGDAQGRAHFGLQAGTYYACASESGDYQERCDRTNPAAHRIIVTNPNSVVTLTLSLTSKLTNPVTLVEAFPVTWSKRKGKNLGWDYGWSTQFGYSFAESAKNPWISTRLVNQDGVVLARTGRERVTGYGSWSAPMGGGIGLECGFMIAASGRQVVVTSTRFEVTASLPSGSRTYRHTAASQANKCSKPRTLVPSSVQWVSAPRAGAMARVSASTWPTGVKLTYRWYLGGKRIKNATTATYRVPLTAGGRELSVKVTGSGKGYTTATQTESQLLKRRSLGKIARPKILGTVRIGRTLSVKSKRIKQTTVRYQWFAGAKKIRGATKTSLKVRAQYRGKRIHVRITAKRKGYKTKTVASKRTRVVASR